MEYVETIVQAVLAFGLINVWVLRNKKSTAYRGKEAKSLKEEFQAYGLPHWMYIAVGTAKLTVAALLIIGFFIPHTVAPAAGILIVLMLGALAMHIKVKDPIKKSVPAFLMLLMSTFLFLAYC
jgi:uncharacterized membrane protein YphA (DoxX/SURF4 family)